MDIHLLIYILLQRNFDKLVAQAIKWEMKLNVNMIHIQKKNLDFQYQINDGVKSMDKEKDLGVISKDLKFSRQHLMTKNSEFNVGYNK